MAAPTLPRPSGSDVPTFRIARPRRFPKRLGVLAVETSPLPEEWSSLAPLGAPSRPRGGRGERRYRVGRRAPGRRRQSMNAAASASGCCARRSSSRSSWRSLGTSIATGEKPPAPSPRGLGAGGMGRVASHPGVYFQVTGTSPSCPSDDVRVGGATTFGIPAAPEGPVVLRPSLATGLPLS